MTLEGRLERIASADEGLWRPRFFDPTREADRALLEDLVASGEVSVYRDTFATQLADWVRAKNPAAKFADPEIARQVGELQAAAPGHGRFVFFPWSRTLVRLLSPEPFEELRTDRNRHKITREEQRLLRTKRIGVVGLSVGKSAAVTLALEGIAGELRLADFDSLGLSNLNRLRASVADLGTNKAVLAAREILEIDPYVKLALFPEGLTETNLDRFFLEGGKLDLVVEECDDFYMKIRIRERARELGVPVLMDTSDRGLLDVERFDREPARPLLHGLVGDLKASALQGLSTKEKIPYVVRILDVRAMSATAAASMIEINDTISSWPQLGSAVTLGGALIADVARRILLDTFRSSGRFYVDLGGLVRDGGGDVVPDASPLLPEPCEEALRARSLSLPPPPPLSPSGAKGPITAAELKYLVAHAALAPSAGNNQPWQFAFRDGVLECRLDTARAPTFLDASYLAIGAAIENLSLAAGACGLEARVLASAAEREAGLVCRVEFERGPERRDPLFSLVTTRVTNRRLAKRVPLAADDAAGLLECARNAGASLAIPREPEALDRIANVMGGVDRLQLTSPTMHRQAMAEMRWSPEEALATRTGLDVSSLEVTAADLAAMRVAASWSTMAEVERVGGGRALEERARVAVAASSCVVLASIEGRGRGAYFAGGRAVQRVWLECTRRGLALQPYSASVYLFARLLNRDGEGDAEGLAPREVEILRGLRAEFERCFPPDPSRTELLLFRLSYADPPRARSLRLGIDTILTF